MEQDGLSVDDVFRQCGFQNDERDMVLKAVRVIRPDYQPTSNFTTSQSLPVLVQDFYAKVSNSDLSRLYL